MHTSSASGGCMPKTLLDTHSTIEKPLFKIPGYPPDYDL